MTSEQPTQPDEAVRALVLRTQDGKMYAIPTDVVEAFRLSDEEQAKVEAGLPNDDDDVQGYQTWDATLLDFQIQTTMSSYSHSHSLASSVLKKQADLRDAIIRNM